MGLCIPGMADKTGPTCTASHGGEAGLHRGMVYCDWGLYFAGRKGVCNFLTHILVQWAQAGN